MVECTGLTNVKLYYHITYNNIVVDDVCSNLPTSPHTQHILSTHISADVINSNSALKPKAKILINNLLESNSNKYELLTN